MNEFPQLASALLTVVFAAVLLVVGQFYIETSSKRTDRVIPAMLSVRSR